MTIQSTHKALFQLLAILLSFWPLPAQGEENRIGFIVPFSGPLAEFGYAIQNGVTLAQETNPQATQIIQPIYRDSRYDSKTALSAFHSLRSSGVNAIYLFGGPMTDTLAPIAEQHKLPLLSTEYDTRYTKGKQYVIRFANDASDFAQAVLSHLRQQERQRLAIVKVENQYHNTFFEAVRSNLRGKEEILSLHTVLPGETDFRTIVSKLQVNNIDALGVYLTPGMQRNFLQQLQNQSNILPLFGTDTFESRAENAGLTKLTNGALYANTAVSQEFQERYHKRFGNTAQVSQAALAYEFILLATEVLSSGEKPKTSKEWIERFAIAGERESVCGKYSYRNSTESGQHFRFPVAVREVREGTPKIIEIVSK